MSSFDPAARQPRRSLTKAQLHTAAGVELLSLCQTITEDGRIDPGELGLLRAWLNEHGSTEFGAIPYLVSTVEEILSDGVITPKEYSELYRAIENVLPPEARTTARDKRKALEATELAARRAVQDDERVARHAESEREAPTAHFDFMVAGVRYENRAALIERHVNDGDGIKLQRDRGNKFSSNAVRVMIEDGGCIGFVPEMDACDLAPLLDDGASYEAYVKKILTGGHVPIPVVVVYTYRSDSTGHSKPTDFVAATSPSEDGGAPDSSGYAGKIVGWLVAAAIGAATAIFLFR